MNLADIFNEKNILVGLRSLNKDDVLRELVDLLHAAGLLHNKNIALSAILERESKMSTGMRGGIAIPHGKIEGIPSLVACMAISKNDIAFGAMDGQPSRIFVMTLSPPDKTAQHLLFLAQITHVFHSPENREAALRAESPADIRALFSY